MTHPHGSKYCPECDTHKPRSDFYGDRTRHDKLQGRCKECSKQSFRHRYKKNPELHRQRINARRATKHLATA